MFARTCASDHHHYLHHLDLHYKNQIRRCVQIICQMVDAWEGFISFSSSSCGKLVVPLIASGLVGPLKSVTRFWNKKLPNFSLKGPKCSHYGFNIKNYILKFAPTVAKYLGYICKKKCHQDLSKLGQSGHTAFE